MAVTVIWSKQARDDFKEVVAYLRENWSDNLATTFAESSYQKIALLETMPEMGISSAKYANVRRILLSRHTVLYYQYEPESIVLFLLGLFDTRQNPENNPFE